MIYFILAKDSYLKPIPKAFEEKYKKTSHTTWEDIIDSFPHKFSLNWDNVNINNRFKSVCIKVLPSIQRGEMQALLGMGSGYVSPMNQLFVHEEISDINGIYDRKRPLVMPDESMLKSDIKIWLDMHNVKYEQADVKATLCNYAKAQLKDK
jgi:hypothetical protein